VWGFGPLTAGNSWAAHGLHLVLRPLGTLLTIALMAAIASSTSDQASKRPGITLSASLAAAAMAQFFYLYWRGQLWAAAKGLSFGYPFLIICVAWYGLSRPPSTLTGWRARWKAGMAFSVSVFLAIQCGLAFYRPWLAAHGTDYAGYIEGHGEYRRHDWNLGPFERVLGLQQGLTVWSAVSNPSIADYIGLVLGWEVHLVNLGANHEGAAVGAPRQHVDRRPDYLIVESSRFGSGRHQGDSPLVARTADLTLLHLGETPVIAEIDGPNGPEGSADNPSFWIGENATILHIVAPADGCAVLQARFLLGPSRPELAYRHLTLATPADSVPQHVLVKDGLSELHFRTARGINDVSLEVEEKANLLLPRDMRPMLLRVDDLRLEHEPCPNDSR
jgi:hypothetical protein